MNLSLSLKWSPIVNTHQIHESTRQNWIPTSGLSFHRFNSWFWTVSFLGPSIHLNLFQVCNESAMNLWLRFKLTVKSVVNLNLSRQSSTVELNLNRDSLWFIADSLEIRISNFQTGPLTESSVRNDSNFNSIIRFTVDSLRVPVWMRP